MSTSFSLIKRVVVYEPLVLWTRVKGRRGKRLSEHIHRESRQEGNTRLLRRTKNKGDLTLRELKSSVRNTDRTRGPDGVHTVSCRYPFT